MFTVLGQSLRPSTGTRLMVARSTSVRHRTLIAAVSAPFGALPVAKGAQPHVLQEVMAYGRAC
jgi:hypothetical protein